MFEPYHNTSCNSTESICTVLHSVSNTCYVVVTYCRVNTLIHTHTHAFYTQTHMQTPTYMRTHTYIFNKHTIIKSHLA